jgi:hypothetical protein
MMTDRAEIELADLARIALVLVILLLVLELVGKLFGWLLGLLFVLRPVILLAVAALVVLWLTDRL